MTVQSFNIPTAAALELKEDVAHCILNFIDDAGTFRAFALTCRTASRAARARQKHFQKQFARPAFRKFRHGGLIDYTITWTLPSGEPAVGLSKWAWRIPQRVGGPGCEEYLCHVDASGVKRCFEINRWKWALGKRWFHRLGGRSFYEEFELDDWEDPPMRERLKDFLAQMQEEEAARCVRFRQRDHGSPLRLMENFGRYGLHLPCDDPRVNHRIRWNDGKIYHDSLPGVEHLQFFKDN